MPQATFYTHVADTAGFVRRLSMRALAGAERVLIWTQTEADAARIDADLWQNPQEGFLPHEIWVPDGPYPEDVALAIACGPELPEVAQDIVVLNLSDQFWCDASAAPKRVLEIVGDAFEDLDAARNRFRGYREKGFVVEHHNMQGKG